MNHIDFDKTMTKLSNDAKLSFTKILNRFCSTVLCIFISHSGEKNIFCKLIKMQKKKIEYYKCVMKLLFDASE